MRQDKIFWSSQNIKLFFTTTVVTTFVAMAVASCGVQTTAIQGSVWIANEGGNSLTVVDAGTQ